MKRRDRASVMIFMVVIMAAMATILMSSVDLGSVIEKRQHQMEREAAWQYATEGAIATAIDKIANGGSVASSFNLDANNVALTVQTSGSLLWEAGNSVQIRISGTLDGKSRSRVFRRSRRLSVNPAIFCFYGLGGLDLSEDLEINDGDAYVRWPISLNGHSLSIEGDLFSVNSDKSYSSLTEGRYYPNQNIKTLSIDLARYNSIASRRMSSGASLNNQTFNSTLSNSEVIYVSGDVTIGGTYRGNGTVVASGNVTLNQPKANSDLDRLVVISTGNVLLSQGNHDVFILCTGSVGNSEEKTGSRSISGSICTTVLNTDSSKWTINFNDAFASSSVLGGYFRIPGQW